MNLTIGGCRGSSPVASSAYTEFGGDTTSFLVRSGADAILVDCGSGLRNLEPFLSVPDDKRMLILLTHYHLDHVVGLPVFSRVHDVDTSIEFAGASHGGVRVEEAVSRLLTQPFGPLPLDALAARFSFREIEQSSAEPVKYGGLSVRWCPLKHPGGATAFRIDDENTAKSVVVATDVEWGLASESDKEALLDLCANPSSTSLLILDGQYDDDEYKGRVGWGHSTWKETVAVAQAAGVDRLVVTHHDPGHDDACLQTAEDSLQETMPSAVFARAGMQVDL